MMLQFFYQPIFEVPHVPQLLNRIESSTYPLSFKVDIDFLDYTIDASLLLLGYNFTGFTSLCSPSQTH